MAVRLSNLSATWATSGSTVNTAILMNVTDTASDPTSKLIDLQVGTSSKFSVDKYGNMIAGNLIAANSSITNISNVASISAQNIFVTTTFANYIATNGLTAQSFVANSYITVTPANGDVEGGQINLVGAGSYDTWYIDSYADSLRFYTGSSNTNTLSVFNFGAGVVNMIIDGSLTVGATNVGATLAAAQGITANVSSRYQLFTASGTAVIPADVTKVLAVVIGGGGGGGGENVGGLNGGEGGYGGVAIGYIDVTPGSSIPVTVGQGGAGTNAAADGSPGNSSAFSSLSATGGSGGLYGVGTSRSASGTGSGGYISTDVNSLFGTFTNGPLLFVASLIGSNPDGKKELFYITSQSPARGNASGATARIPYVSQTSTVTPGAGGQGETSATGNASGGVDGAVLLFY